jgi:hypothetical protein
MENPFKKRATEFIEDPVSLLPLLSPQPIRLFFEGNAASFFDRLAIIVGTPGSGKTTIARLLEFGSLSTLMEFGGRDLRDLTAVLAECGILKDGRPKHLGFRLPPSSNFREIWELPYSESVRGLLLHSLIQAKTVLGWMRQLERRSHVLQSVRIECKEGTEAQRDILRTHNAIAFRERAREVEEEIYKVITALVPPAEAQLSQHLQYGRFDAFDILSSIVVPATQQGSEELQLQPMVMIDDAHELHPRQFASLELWLRSREMKIARWIMTRIDAISPDDLRKALTSEERDSLIPGSSTGRDRILKLIQRNRSERSGFRQVARDISRRYMEQMPVLQRRSVKSLEDCLSAPAQPIAPSQQRQLAAAVESLERDINPPEARRTKLWESIPDKFLVDERLATYRILLHREKRKVPQRDIFVGMGQELPEDGDAPGAQVKSSLVDGAAIHLLHQFGRPFYFGFNRLADASNDNIEQFINLAGALVESIEIQLLRGREPRLDAREQHRVLFERAKQTIQLWDFPHCTSVQKLVQFIAQKCIDKTLEPNAPLDDGANAFGVPQSEVDQLSKRHPELARVLHFALAYNAVLLNEHYECKGKTWCLFELGGLPIIANRLTLHRGGFCEGHVSHLVESIAEEAITQ